MNVTFDYSTHLVESIMDSTEDGIVLFSPVYDDAQEIVDFKYVYVNTAAENFIEQSKESLCQASLLTTYDNKYDYRSIFNTYKEAYVSGKEFRSDRYYSREGLQKWYKITAKRCESLLLVNFNDVSEYMSLMNDKSKSENLYRTLFKNLPNAEIALVDDKLKLLLSEGAPLKAFGHKEELTEAKLLPDLLLSEEQKVVLPILKDCLKGKGKKLEIEKNDEFFRLNFIPVKDNEHKIFAVLIVSEDIGIFNFTNDELRNKIYELENANQSLEQFAYVASHDLQEPLRKIRAFGDRLHTKYKDQLEDTAQDYIQRMQNAAGRMQKLIDDLLKYSRVGRFQEPFQPILLNELINNIVDNLDNLIEESEASVEIKDLPTVEGDSGSLDQLFTNLLTNAIKFRKEDEALKISIWSDQSEEDEVLMHNIYVKDTGIGFDEKYLDKIFNIFQRLHGRNEYAGTGIGLAICRKIIDMHDGNISAKSKPGEGATFIVSFPVK